MIKTCPKCKKKLDIDHFNWKIKNIRRASCCKICSREYIKNHYNQNKGYYLKKAKKRNKSLKKLSQKYIASFLQKHPCVDCGEIDILVLEFDHINKNDKQDNISKLLKNKLSIDKLTQEIKHVEYDVPTVIVKKLKKKIIVGN